MTSVVKSLLSAMKSTRTGVHHLIGTFGSVAGSAWIVTVNGRSLDVNQQVTIPYNGKEYTYNILTWMGNISDRELSEYSNQGETNITFVRKGLGIPSCGGGSMLRHVNSKKIANLKEPMTVCRRQSLLAYGRPSGIDSLLRETRAMSHKRLSHFSQQP